MNSNIVFHGVFCDDIRQEVGNKVTLVGCYGNELQTNSLPTVLPKICVHFSILSNDKDDGTEKDVNVFTLLDNERGPKVNFKLKNGGQINGGFELQGVKFKQGSNIVLKANIEGKEYIGGKLLIKTMSETENTEI